MSTVCLFKMQFPTFWTYIELVFICWKQGLTVLPTCRSVIRPCTRLTSLFRGFAFLNIPLAANLIGWQYSQCLSQCVSTQICKVQISSETRWPGAVIKHSALHWAFLKLTMVWGTKLSMSNKDRIWQDVTVQGGTGKCFSFLLIIYTEKSPEWIHDLIRHSGHIVLFYQCLYRAYNVDDSVRTTLNASFNNDQGVNIWRDHCSNLSKIAIFDHLLILGFKVIGQEKIVHWAQ